MSFFALSWSKGARTGSPTRKAVLLILCEYANPEGYCWPSQETIATETELTERSVRTALADLEAEGFIERTPRARRADATRQTDLIRIVFARAPIRKELPASPPDLPETDDQTIRKEFPNHPEGASGKPPGEPLLEPGEGAQARPARATFLPESWKPEARHVAVGVREGLNARQLDRAARKFVLHYREIGRPLKDWDAAWERWTIREGQILGIAPELELAPPTGTEMAGRVWHHRESPGFAAWTAWRRAQGGRGYATDSKGGWWFDSEWPPGHAPPADQPEGERHG